MRIVPTPGRSFLLARAKRLELLRNVVRGLVIPEAVERELLGQGKGKLGAAVIAEARWIEVQSVWDRKLVDDLSRKLHLGEREAIALAHELGSALLVDEKEARKQARLLGVAHFGSLRVLKEAKDRGVVTAVKPVLDDLLRSGTYVSAQLYREFLTQAGEE